MMGRPTGCASHRATLAMFAERGERRVGDPGTAAAFAHLDGCRRCQAEVADTRLAIHALRRTLASASTADPATDAWDRLRARVQRPVANAWAARTSLAGVVVGAGLVAALIGPTAAFRLDQGIQQEPGPGSAVLRARTVADQRAETAFLTRARPERPRQASVPAIAPTATWSGPDGLGRPAPVRVDVAPDRAD
jgi:hypothetical protein